MKKKQVGKYLFGLRIGSGKYGDVNICYDTEDENKVYSVKTISKEKVNSSPLHSKLFKSEVDIMTSINHPNILHLYDYLVSSNNFYLVTQYCEDGDLKSYVEKRGHLTESEAIFFLKQILTGFAELHSHKIMHRDFKLANIFLHKGRIVIGDFGFAKAGIEMTDTRLGTPYTMAPEVLFDTKAPYTNKSDIWSIGVVLFQMLFGRLPFSGQHIEALKGMIIERSGQNLRFPKEPIVSKNIKELLTKMIEKNPENRINWHDLFNHCALDFEQENNQNKDVNNSQENNNLMQGYNSENNSIKKERQREVNLSFGRERLRASDFSHTFELNDPLTMIESPEYKSKWNEERAQLLDYEECSAFFSHEHNKCLFLFRSSKLARDLSKDLILIGLLPSLETCAVVLSQKGLLTLSHLINIVKNKINVYELMYFKEFCVSKSGSALLESLISTKKTFETYLSHLLDKCAKVSGAVIAELNSGILLIPKIDNQLHSTLLRISAIREQSRTDSRIQKLTVFLGLCLQIDSSFPLISRKDQSYFDWPGYFADLDQDLDVKASEILKQYRSSDNDTNCQKLCTIKGCFN